ncbi:MAG: glycosyltransferase family 2 protein [Lachnospiraceae bacterium]
MKEKISVIVPAYHAEPFLEGCLKSICCQTYDDLEILVIDNGSTDRTGEIADRLAAEDSRIKVIHEEKTGVSGARNAGIEQATGAYLTFVDADDRICPKMIETLYRALHTNGCDVAGCDFFMTDTYDVFKEPMGTDGAVGNTADSGQNQKESVLYEEAELLNGSEFIKHRLFDGDSRCWSKLYSRDSIGDTRFRQGLTIGEDMLFVLEIMQKNVKTVHLPYQGYYYYHNPEGAMETAFRPSYMDQITCWQEAEKRIGSTEAELSDRIHRVILVSVMLVAGKLALARGIASDEKKRYIKTCRQTIEGMGKESYWRAYRLLSGSDKLKVSCFRHLPDVYLFLWKQLKKIHAI